MMKVSLKNFQLGLLFMAFFAVVSCDDNDEIQIDPDKDYDVELTVAQGGAANPNAPVTVNASTQSTVSAKVTFTSTDKSMKRLYITQNVGGQGETIYKPTESVDLKADGAVDLTGKNANNFDYAFELPVPSGISTGTVVYKFWTTTGNGDPRDLTQRLAVGPGTITLNYGGTNPSVKVKSYADVKLAAPLADGSSSTFLSLLDGKVYKINQGEEYVTYWDFGYYYLTSGANASLASTAGYNPLVVNIPQKANTSEDLNKVFFNTSSKTTAEFDAIAISADLDYIQASANQTITGLTANSVVEFVNQYGKKGLIKVLEVSGTDGSTSFIRIAVKVQP
jgi:hypothetical protein